MVKEAVWETKFKIAEYLHNHCPAGAIANEDKNTCSDFIYIDRELDTTKLEQDEGLKPIEFLPYNRFLDGPIKNINEKIAYINRLMPNEQYRRAKIEAEYEELFSMLSIFLVILAIVGLLVRLHFNYVEK